MNFIKWIATAMLLMGLTACVTNPVQLFESKGTKTLAAGETLYNNGQFVEALRSFQTALELGLSTTEQVRAHKLMAFTHCVTSQVVKCRESFKKALEVNPGFELEASEAGHPAWGPVFRQARQVR